MKKILILILSCNHPVYKLLANEGINKTWNSIDIDNMPTFFYEGGYKESYRDKSTIYLTESDDYANITKKTIEAFSYCIDNFDFDYIFRTNSSSYVNKYKLLEWLSDKPLNNFYSGIIGVHNNIKYASGSGYSISKDLVEKILKNKNLIDINDYDDISVGKFLNTDIFPAPRKDLDCATSIDYEIDKYFHYRCKCASDRNIDIKHMINIHNSLNRDTINENR